MAHVQETPFTFISTAEYVSEWVSENVYLFMYLFIYAAYGKVYHTYLRVIVFTAMTTQDEMTLCEIMHMEIYYHNNQISQSPVGEKDSLWDYLNHNGHKTVVESSVSDPLLRWRDEITFFFFFPFFPDSWHHPPARQQIKMLTCNSQQSGSSNARN